MRPLKFRGWNKVTKRMIDPQKLTPLALNSECKDLKGVFLPFHDDIELMQFTELHDVHNKEIWEGDIVKKIWHKTYSENKVVAWGISGWYPFEYNGGGEFDANDIEVIGNIYENRELLGK